MSCSDSKIEPADEAAPCQKCGKVQHEELSPSCVQGYWEYAKFSESLQKYTLGRKYYSLTWPIFGELPDETMRRPINRAVQAILSRVVTDGWEPAEPIDVTNLCKAGCVFVKWGGGFPGHLIKRVEWSR